MVHSLGACVFDPQAWANQLERNWSGHSIYAGLELWCGEGGQ